MHYMPIFCYKAKINKNYILRQCTQHSTLINSSKLQLCFPDGYKLHAKVLVRKHDSADMSER